MELNLSIGMALHDDLMTENRDASQNTKQKFTIPKSSQRWKYTIFTKLVMKLSP